MFKKVNIAIVALFVVASVSRAGVLNDAILTSWRNGLAVKDVSGSNIVTALTTVAANITSATNADPNDGLYIKGFVTDSTNGLDGAITNLNVLSEGDGKKLAAAVRNFFAKTNTVFALKGLASYQAKWLGKIRKISK